MKTQKSKSTSTSIIPLEKVVAIRLAGEPFSWPEKFEDSYYVVDTKAELVLLCMPGGFQAFYAEYSVPPGEGLHFIRVSKSVVVQSPELFDDKPLYKEIIRGLGITVAEVPDLPHVDSKQYKDRNRFGDEVEAVGHLLDPHSFSGLNVNTAHLIALWAFFTDSKSPDHQEVVVALARDLSKTPSWTYIEKEVGQIMKRRGVDFETITLLGPERKIRRKPLYFLHHGDKKSLGILKSCLREQAKLPKGRSYDARWAIRRGLIAPKITRSGLFEE